MKWRKSPDSLVRLFDHSLPIIEGVQRKAMFGYPCAFLNGHLFCGLHGDSIIALLPEARRDALLAAGASVFEPMPGQPMKEYVVVPAEIVADRRRLRELLGDALAHVSSLAPKPQMPRAAKKNAPARKTRSAKKVRARKAAPAKKKAARKAGPEKRRAR
jgi:TfoX N-terminal domain